MFDALARSSIVDIHRDRPQLIASGVRAISSERMRLLRCAVVAEFAAMC